MNWLVILAASVLIFLFLMVFVPIASMAAALGISVEMAKLLVFGIVVFLCHKAVK